MPKVSVILPSLNVHEYIEECLTSVCNQTLKDIEIICVDAGSTDGTLEVIKDFVKKDKRVKLINSPRKSYGLQMNIGIDYAEGEYIGIVETDDYVRPEMYDNLYEIAKKNDLDFIKADFYRFNHNENGDEVLYLNKLSNNNYYYNRVIEPRKEKETFNFVMNTWSGIYRKEFLLRNNIRHNETAGASFQDTDFWFQTFSLAKRAYFLDKPYYMNRRDNPNSSVYSNKKIYAFCDEFDYIYSTLFKESKNKDLMPEYQFFRYRSYMSSLNKCTGDEKRKFVERFKNDLLISKNKGELDLSRFTEGGKKTVELILNETDKFIHQQEKKKPVAYKLGTNSKEVLISSKLDGNPKISVIIPIFNAEKFIETCLKSVLKQTLSDIEVILINDGSTDSSVDKIKEICKTDKRITLLSQPNSGSGIARNFGLKFAKGEFIAFMDADDWYPDSDILETLYNKAKLNNASICGGSFSNSKNGIVTKKFIGNYTKYTFEKEGFVNFSDYQFDYGYHRFIYSAELIKSKNIEFPNLLRFQDPPFFLQCMEAADRFYAIPKVVYCYRKGENIVKWNERKIVDLLDGILFEIKFSKKNNLAKLHRIAVDHLNVEFMKVVQPFVDFNYMMVLERIFEINKEIDPKLLNEAGYKLDLTKKYSIKLIRRFAERCNPVIKLISIETNAGRFTVDSNQLNSVKTSKQEEKIEKLEKKINKLITGPSYRIGRIITFIPRKIMEFWK